MHSFTDTKGRDWEIDLSQGAIRKAVKDKRFQNASSFEEFYGEVNMDLLLLADFLWFCNKDKASEQNIKESEFLDSLDGDVMENALEALREEMLLYLPKLRRQALLAGIARVEQMSLSSGSSSQPKSE